MKQIPDRLLTIMIYAALGLATFVAFESVRHYDFINFDDAGYVSENKNVKAGLTTESIIWAFTTTHTGYWHPLTWLSHMLDCQLFGTDAGWHHLINLLLHIVNALLLFGVLKKMTGALWKSAFVAALFALHPLHVESVAWISERKDVLSTLFWILTMAAYLGYVRKPDMPRYLLTLLCLVLGLMTKPMLVTLPFVLLLLDYWPLGRFEFGKSIKNADDIRSQWRALAPLVWEKIPFFALSAISCVITFLSQRSSGVVVRIDLLGPVIRIANAITSYTSYIAKMIWPSKLTVFYPYTNVSIFIAAASALLLLGISRWVIIMGRQRRYLPVGWFWYLGTLVPVIGLVQVGEQRLADRYTYVPLTGLFIIIAWGAPELLTKWQYRKGFGLAINHTTGRKILLSASAMIILLASLICTRLQVRHWRNSITVFEHALEVTENNYMAHYCLAGHLNKQDKVNEAITHYTESLRINPNFPYAHNNLAIILAQQGRLDEAIAHYTEVLRINPNSSNAHNNLAITLAQQGRLDEAIAHYTETLRIEPNFRDAHNNLAIILAQQGRLDEAIKHFREAIRLSPQHAKAHSNLAKALTEKGRTKEAITHFREALRLNPNDAQARQALQNYRLYREGLQKRKSN